MYTNMILERQFDWQDCIWRESVSALFTQQHFLLTFLDVFGEEWHLIWNERAWLRQLNVDRSDITLLCHVLLKRQTKGHILQSLNVWRIICYANTCIGYCANHLRVTWFYFFYQLQHFRCSLYFRQSDKWLVLRTTKCPLKQQNTNCLSHV